MPSRWTRSIPDVRPSSTNASSIARDLLEQPQLRPRRRDRDRVEQRPGAGGQAGRSGEHGVAHALGERPPARRERLGDVERVAACDAVKLGGVDLVGPREVVDRALGERLELEAGHGGARQLAEHAAQRIGAADLVVAVGDDDKRRRRLDTASEQAHEVERRAVCAVQVFDDDEVRRLPAQLAEERREHVDRPRPALDEPLELAARLARDIDERPERPGRLERLAGAREHAGGGDVQAERLDERRLPDPRLAADHHQPAAARGPDGSQRIAERVELRGALEQVLGGLDGAGGRDQGGGRSGWVPSSTGAPPDRIRILHVRPTPYDKP